jgi:hypothetical protein
MRRIGLIHNISICIYLNYTPIKSNALRKSLEFFNSTSSMYNHFGTINTSIENRTIINHSIYVFTYNYIEIILVLRGWRAGSEHLACFRPPLLPAGGRILRLSSHYAPGVYCSTSRLVVWLWCTAYIVHRTSDILVHTS